MRLWRWKISLSYAIKRNKKVHICRTFWKQLTSLEFVRILFALIYRVELSFSFHIRNFSLKNHIFVVFVYISFIELSGGIRAHPATWQDSLSFCVEVNWRVSVCIISSHHISIFTDNFQFEPFLILFMTLGKWIECLTFRNEEESPQLHWVEIFESINWQNLVLFLHESANNDESY